MSAVAILGLIGVAIVLTVRRRYHVVTVHGDSMLPALASGCRVLVQRTSTAAIRNGDIVVLAHPWQSQLNAHGAQPWLIKRVAALPGDAVPPAVLQGLRDPDTRIGRRTQPLPHGAVVPAGAMVVLGDNQDSSTDSRNFGYAHSTDLLGVVVRILHAGGGITRAQARAGLPVRPAGPPATSPTSDR